MKAWMTLSFAAVMLVALTGVQAGDQVMEEIVVTAKYPDHLLMEEIVVTAQHPTHLIMDEFVEEFVVSAERPALERPLRFF